MNCSATACKAGFLLNETDHPKTNHIKTFLNSILRIFFMLTTKQTYLLVIFVFIFEKYQKCLDRAECTWKKGQSSTCTGSPKKV